jgi:hypothetical protein
VLGPQETHRPGRDRLQDVRKLQPARDRLPDLTQRGELVGALGRGAEQPCVLDGDSRLGTERHQEVDVSLLEDDMLGRRGGDSVEDADGTDERLILHEGHRDRRDGARKRVEGKPSVFAEVGNQDWDRFPPGLSGQKLLRAVGCVGLHQVEAIDLIVNLGLLVDQTQDRGAGVQGAGRQPRDQSQDLGQLHRRAEMALGEVLARQAREAIRRVFHAAHRRSERWPAPSRRRVPLSTVAIGRHTFASRRYLAASSGGVGLM